MRTAAALLLTENKLLKIGVYDANAKINLGHFDVFNNNRSFPKPANLLINGDEATPYRPGGDIYFPSETIVALPGLFYISKIVISETGSGANLTIDSGLTIGTVTHDTTITLNTGSVQTINLSDKQAKFVKFVVTGNTAIDGPSEIKIYGRVITPEVVPAITPRPYKGLSELFGGNGDKEFRTDLYPWPGYMIREYDFPSKIQNDTGTLYAFQPCYIQEAHLDDHYQFLHERGQAALPLYFQAQPEALYRQGYDAANVTWTNEYNEIQYGADINNPLSWANTGNWCYQQAARYGGTVVPNANILVDTTFKGNIKRSGLGYIQYFECGNEYDRWWQDKERSLKASEAAVKLSVAYDGHCGTIPLCGYKAADPTCKVVMGALADFNLDYIKYIYYWSLENRADGKVPFDAVNVHSYLTKFGGQYQANDKAIHPEAYTRPGYLAHGVYEYLQEFTDWITRYLPGVEIWWTETGTDSNPNSTVGVPLPTQAEAALQARPLNSYEKQAAWSMRLLFESMRGQFIDKILIYSIFNYSWCDELIEHYSDVNANYRNDNWIAGGYGDDTQFNTSGDLVAGQYCWLRSDSSPKTIDGTLIGTSITFTFPSQTERPYYSWNNGDVVDAKMIGNYQAQSNRITGIVTASTDTSLTLYITGISGSGTISTWRIETPFPKKPGWFAKDNSVRVLGSTLKFLRNDSTNEYRHIVWSNGSKEVHTLWSPTDAGIQINRTVSYRSK
jgi:hypothetical protein